MKFYNSIFIFVYICLLVAIFTNASQNGRDKLLNKINKAINILNLEQNQLANIRTKKDNMKRIY
jgi:hypothetical protein